MKKRLIALFVAIALVLNLIVAGAAVGLIRDIRAQIRQDFTIVIDGVVRNFKNAQGDAVYPVLYDGTTYLPVRAIGELMGKEVYWYEGEKKIELRDKEIKPTVTDADVIVDEKKEKEAPPAPKQKKEEVDKSKFIGEEKAKQVALDRAGIAANGVYFDRIELDFENGEWRYELEFKKNRIEYEADIRAADGKILKWEVDKD